MMLPLVLPLLLPLLLLAACSSTPPPPPVDPAARRAAWHASLQAQVSDGWALPVPEVEVADPAVGAQVYAKTCRGCHGDRGAGDGPRAPALNPAPGNLRTSPLPEAGLLAAIRSGSPGTAMAAYGQRLPDDQLVAVARYLRDLRADEPVSP